MRVHCRTDSSKKYSRTGRCAAEFVAAQIAQKLRKVDRDYAKWCAVVPRFIFMIFLA